MNGSANKKTPVTGHPGAKYGYIQVFGFQTYKENRRPFICDICGEEATSLVVLKGEQWCGVCYDTVD